MSKSKDQAIVFHDDNTLEIIDVVEADAEGVETKNALYPTSEAEVYLNRTRGAMTYVYNADLPTKLEAEKLKSMRRSTVLKRAFDFKTDDKLDFMKVLPYLIIAMLIVFK
ncbi:hypothetical protein [Paenibacillus larvae]|uniref:Uncharacterized protein n=1 Tax=Paenibacillus larvae subsp. larvae DSM 25430 TaxID=697284 RepID=V9WD92_9BACL|nr:hypothetical protein [Paenibacillus larvae]AHD07799.1 hypothetical protein ERIC2_10p00150 [Paenibacillus larvae subsp. larvae DSM 25430]AVG14379.1 hypothetical protein ERICII_04151 [Paenibacillus larvae subsp. larvae DSM 25430]MDR5570289.1 hypothetical protein [Paenibacillus larvae]